MAYAQTEVNLGTVGTTEVNVYGSTQTTDVTLSLSILVDSAANGDIFEVQIKETMNSSVRTHHRSSFGHALAGTEPHTTPPLMLGVGYQVTVRKLTGTDRNVRVTRYEVT